MCAPALITPQSLWEGFFTQIHQTSLSRPNGAIVPRPAASCRARSRRLISAAHQNMTSSWQNDDHFGMKTRTKIALQI